jgi:hypothetical protein
MQEVLPVVEIKSATVRHSDYLGICGQCPAIWNIIYLLWGAYTVLV